MQSVHCTCFAKGYMAEMLCCPPSMKDLLFTLIEKIKVCHSQDDTCTTISGVESSELGEKIASARHDDGNLWG